MAGLTRPGRSCKPGQGLWKAIWEHIFQSWPAGNESTKIAVRLSTTCNGKERKQPKGPTKRKKLAAPVFTMDFAVIAKNGSNTDIDADKIGRLVKKSKLENNVVMR